MQNRITFSNVIGVLLENKKKTYAQYQMIEDIFYDCLCNMDLFEKEDFEKNVTYSRWCTGERPIPKEILSFYDNAGFDGIQDNIQEDVIPNLINVTATRKLLLELVMDSVDVIGTKKADEFARITDDAEFITALVRYAILNDHNSRHTLSSPDLSDILLSNKLPSVNRYFIGRKEELKVISKALQENNLVFITGTAGIGKNELAKTFAKKSEKKYTNIIHLFYGGDLKKCVAYMEFSDDTADMNEEMLFDRHMRILKKLHSDSLIIIDNFNVLPKEDAFFKEFIKLNCKILVTSRCNISQYETINISDIVDDGSYFLLFLQDMFPYLDKYLVSDYLPKLTERISYVMDEYKLESPCDKALLLDYKAECFLLKKDYGNAVKKREKAISILEKFHNKDANMRTANLLSNLYNNLSNTYLLMKRGNEATKALRTAFDIRMEYAHLGLAESHDSLQQMMNLINMLLLAKDVDNAKIVLEQYEILVLEHLSDTSLDYGICKLSRGIIDMMEGKPEPAEINLLGAESIIGNAVGSDNDYMKTTYRYLNNLYARWKKPEKAIAYRDKFLGVKQTFLKQLE